MVFFRNSLEDNLFRNVINDYILNNKIKIICKYLHYPYVCFEGFWNEGIFTTYTNFDKVIYRTNNCKKESNNQEKGFYHDKSIIFIYLLFIFDRKKNSEFQFFLLEKCWKKKF